MFARPIAVRTASRRLRCLCVAVEMPLRARLLDPTLLGRASMSSNPPMIREEPGDEVDDVLFDTLYNIRTIELNRPKKLNSLNGSMARKIIPRLQEWEKSQMANIILIRGSGPKAFCAGGDVTALAKQNTQGAAGQQESKNYFALEYQLDHLIATYTKPFIAVIDGITMGGGVGLSVHAPFRIATERTVFAMPETSIGLFPDVGGSFFLSRLNGEVGTYLALTSQQLRGVDLLYAGIATHYLHSSTIPALTSRLSELTFEDSLSYMDRLRIIAHTLHEYSSGLPSDPPVIAGQTRLAIDRCFGHDTIAKIVSALEREGTEWASQTLSDLGQRSPTSLAVTLRAQRLGKSWNIKETFQREYIMASKFMEHPDFTNGVTSKLINKTQTTPRWSPSSLTDPIDTDPFFTTKGQTMLPLLRDQPDQAWSDYPHAWTGLPRERDVEQVVKAGGMSREGILQEFLQRNEDLEGVDTVVRDILERKTTGDGNALRWIG